MQNYDNKMEIILCSALGSRTALSADVPQVVFLIAGHARIESDENSYQLQPFSSIFLKPHTAYRWIMLSDTVEGVTIKFFEGAPSNYVKDRYPVELGNWNCFEALINLSNERQARFFQLYKILKEYYQADSSISDFACVNTVEMLLLECFGTYSQGEDSSGRSNRIEAGRSQLIKDVIAYINEKYHEEIGLESISRKFWVSPAYLSRQFKEKTGGNISAFISEQRVYVAQRLLITSDLQVSEIASKVGFSGATYFSKVFKSIVGLTPSQYRKHQSPRVPATLNLEKT